MRENRAPSCFRINEEPHDELARRERECYVKNDVKACRPLKRITLRDSQSIVEIKLPILIQDTRVVIGANISMDGKWSVANIELTCPLSARQEFATAQQRREYRNNSEIRPLR